MKNLLVTASFFLASLTVFGQQEAVEYMNQFTAQYTTIQEDMWDYTRTISRGRGARKVEKRRAELIASSDAALKKAERVDAFEGDEDFKNAVVEYFRIINIVLKEDYEKIVDMEEIAEQSYDAMEAYMMARDAAGDKQTDAAEMVNEAQKKFAEEHDITLIESEDDVDSKMTIAGRVYDHYNEVFLIFFKSNKQELYLLDAMSASDISAIEQNREALKMTLEEGMAALENVTSYEGDKSMIEATEALFKFYQQEEKDAQLAVDFLLKQENFMKIKEAFDQIKEKNRTQEDIDSYNNAVNEMNTAAEAVNASSEENNKMRSKLVDAWNDTAEKFTNKHVPRGK